MSANAPLNLTPMIQDFCSETLKLIVELESHLDVVEEKPKDKSPLNQFILTLDDIMSSAKAIGAKDISTVCELGKLISHKGIKLNDETMFIYIIATLFDALNVLKFMIQKLSKDLGKKTTSYIHDINAKSFINRLQWLSEKFKTIENKEIKNKVDQKKSNTTSSKPNDKSSAGNKNSYEGDLDIDDLLKDLGF